MDVLRTDYGYGPVQYGGTTYRRTWRNSRAEPWWGHNVVRSRLQVESRLASAVFLQEIPQQVSAIRDCIWPFLRLSLRHHAYNYQGTRHKEPDTLLRGPVQLPPELCEVTKPAIARGPRWRAAVVLYYGLKALSSWHPPRSLWSFHRHQPSTRICPHCDKHRTPQHRL